MKFLYWNIRGLNNPQKQFTIKQLILEMKINIFLLQEVKMPSQTFAEVAGKLWPGVNSLYVDALGASWGIATLWDPIKMKGKIFASSQNFLAVSLHYGEQCWQMFNIYAPNSRLGRWLLWEEISNIIVTNQKNQFMLVGDFNSPVYPSEKCGGLEDFSDSMGNLASFINASSLMDIDLLGAPLHLVE